MRYQIAEINQLSQQDFIEVLGGIFEDSPWVAEKVYRKRPFADLSSLHQAMVGVVRNASLEEQLELIRSHPDLGSKLRMSESSVQEQAGAGLDRLSGEEFDRFHSLNQRYKKKFGFPFIIAVKNHTKQSILNAFSQRLENPKDAEIQTALQEIAQIAWLRLREIIQS
ncbi:2-oxo-4-hydroxy-4-carboxy-5-ureidoimidazoline decarboxylase [Planktothrix sp. FACHB-1355]|uniref:2-oxo-4-hydroxy-4-carboxy-5-ureidoimidazoline decarboxylase n=1 Tax=Aerosakkonema funiforme FACHB-1375 TaxID=2949571 RepID=A0A926VG48_9CYAN|nr:MULTISPECIES: 2-oxo-4-hydroxy-4-carboxy-5-ureidoimidazoline decarboxylase [Oscillatoriales]MBD2182024.1 2-oxo-4-hydroxy-4-carboxy-5-ureidoimidazoline decarboxylase [Aerosakkonema funiforme FACHB-1375]MBD3559662.1 2-oxo-4-hydroxy-4-carboxy-5-ureidoimidazoline decarboxylase [Planktothrix sp. FACHB-1355]